MLEKLLEKQIVSDLTDTEFAAKLGIPRSTWQLTRSGTVPLGRRVVSAAARTYPELMPDAISFLLSNAKANAQ